jgi:hypothetical protein
MVSYCPEDRQRGLFASDDERPFWQEAAFVKKAVP